CSASAWPRRRASRAQFVRDAELHLLRADGRHHQRAESRPQRCVQGTANHQAWWNLGGELLGETERILGDANGLQALGFGLWASHTYHAFFADLAGSSRVRRRAAAATANGGVRRSPSRGARGSVLRVCVAPTLS